VTRLALVLRCSDSLISDLRCDMCVARGSRSLRSRPVGGVEWVASGILGAARHFLSIRRQSYRYMTHVAEDAEHAQRAKNATEA